jgi:predicted RNA-binding Zn-ribbon protein involved in translation (DUF1610 family)
VKEIVGNEHLSDETMFCPECGCEIEYENYPPHYCPNCGARIEIRIIGEE